MDMTTSIFNTTITEPDCKFFNFIVWGCVVMAMCYFGYVGNLLSFLALQRDSRSPAVTLLQSLAISDVVLLLSINITDAIPYVCEYSECCPNLWKTWPYIRYLWLLTPVGHMCSIWLVVLVAANRYWAVCRPHSAGEVWSNLRTYVYVFVVLCFAVVFNIPRFFEYEVVDVRSPVPVKPVGLLVVPDAQRQANGDGYLNVVNNSVASHPFQLTGLVGITKKEHKTSFGLSPLYRVGYKVIVVNILLVIFPLLFIFFTSVWIIKSLNSSERIRSSKARIPSTHGGLEDGRNESCRVSHSREVTFLLVAVVLVAVACQTPLAVFHFVRYMFTYGCGDVVFYLESASKLLVTLNSCINFIVYCVLSPKFRRLLKQLITCSKPPNKRLQCIPDSNKRCPQNNTNDKSFPLVGKHSMPNDDEAVTLITKQRDFERPK